MKVRMHVRSPGDKDWTPEAAALLDFARLPVVGECVALSFQDSFWHRVELVVHIAHPDADGGIAELYCCAVDQVEILQDLLGELD